MGATCSGLNNSPRGTSQAASHCAALSWPVLVLFDYQGEADTTLADAESAPLVRAERGRLRVKGRPPILHSSFCFRLK